MSCGMWIQFLMCCWCEMGNRLLPDDVLSFCFMGLASHVSVSVLTRSNLLNVASTLDWMIVWNWNS